MFTRKDFIATAALIKKVPKAKRFKEFEKWCDKFTDDNDLFDEAKFANACGFYFDETQSEYRPLKK